jgi:hypothetical protein
MKTAYRFVTLMLCCFTIPSFAQVSNVVTKLSEERDKVTITYDLARNPRITFYSIKVAITLDGETVPTTGLSGDLGPQVTAGFGKKIIWDVNKDLGEISGELKVVVSTDTKAVTNCRPINAVPAYAGLGTVAISGIGLIVSGLSVNNNSKELYDVYKANLNPSDPAFTELSREDHYAQANKKHKLALGLMSGGGAILAVGGTAFIMRTIKIRNYNRKCAGYSDNSPRQRFEFQPVMVGTTGVGVGLSYRF